MDLGDRRHGNDPDDDEQYAQHRQAAQSGTELELDTCSGTGVNPLTPNPNLGFRLRENGVKPTFKILLKKDDISLNLSGNILKKMILTNSFIFPKNII